MQLFKASFIFFHAVLMVLLIRLSEADAQFGSVVGCPLPLGGSRIQRPPSGAPMYTNSYSHAAGEPQSASRTPLIS